MCDRSFLPSLIILQLLKYSCRIHPTRIPLLFKPFSKALLNLQSNRYDYYVMNRYSLLSYFTSDGFEIHRCINTNDYSVVSDPFLLVSFLHYLHPSSLERFRLSEYAANTEWLQQESDVFRGFLSCLMFDV